MTSAKAAFSADIAISTDGRSTWTSLAEQASYTVSITATAIDVTNFDTNVGVEEFIAGTSNWTMSSDGNYIDTDAGQVAVFNNIATPAEIDIRLRPDGAGAGLVELVSSQAGVLTSMELGGDVADRQTFSMEYQGSGELTRNTQ